jgi:hypothetical protein
MSLVLATPGCQNLSAAARATPQITSRLAVSARVQAGRGSAHAPDVGGDDETGTPRLSAHLAGERVLKDEIQPFESARHFIMRVAVESGDV